MRPNSALRLAARATAIGAVAAVLLLAGLIATSVLTTPQHGPCWAGLALAIVTTALGNLLLASSLLDSRASSGARLGRAMFTDFVLHLAVGGGAVIAVFLVGTKFLAAATFALAFAVAVVVMRIIGAVSLSRAMAVGVRPPERRS